MYDYILPVSNKDIVNIAKRAFNLVDPRLMGHGERVANIMFQIMEAEGGYTPVQMRNLLTLAVLHDIGRTRQKKSTIWWNLRQNMSGTIPFTVICS